MPIDSNLGNLCLPKENKIKGNYYCYLILKNNYNEFNNNFAISSTNHNEQVKINITKVYKETKEEIHIEPKNYIYLYKENDNDIDYFRFIFEFKKNEIKNIITSFCSKGENSSPQVYSTQMYYFYDFNDTSFFKQNGEYEFDYQFIGGEYGFFGISSDLKFSLSPNLRGNPLKVDALLSNNYSLSTISDELIFFSQFIYNRKAEGIEELKIGEPFSQMIIGEISKLYYYLKIKEYGRINIEVTLKIKDYNDIYLDDSYKFSGYIISEDKMQRKINGEFIELDKPIEGKYINSLGIGYLQLNKSNRDNNDQYLFIIIKNIKAKQTLPSIIELSAEKYDENIPVFLPINKYIMGKFYGENSTIITAKHYYIPIDKGNISIELSSEYDDIQIKFNNNITNFNINYIAGFKKYIINNNEEGYLYFNITNELEQKANYMIRYFYEDYAINFNYIFDDEYKMNIIESNENNVTINLTFNSIKVETSSLSEINVVFFITGSLYNKTENSSELINTTCELKEQQLFYQNISINTYDTFYSTNNTQWSLIFENISRNHNYNFDLQLKIKVLSKYKLFDDDFLIFTTKVNLTGIKEERIEKPDYMWILYAFIGIVAIILIIFFIKKFIKLKKKNDSLKQEMVNIAFSNDIQNNVLFNERNISRNESDLESIFI